MTEARHISLPSGQPVALQEVRAEDTGAGVTLRFRFVAPELTAERAAEDFETVARDLEALCNDFALRNLPQTATRPDLIVVSMAQTATEFGVAAPDVPQVFEAFSVSADGRCQWEPF